MTPEEGACEVIRRALPEYQSTFVPDGFFDVEAIHRDMYRLSSGEKVIAQVAAELFQWSGSVGSIARYVDIDRKAAILGVLSAVWLGGPSVPLAKVAWVQEHCDLCGADADTECDQDCENHDYYGAKIQREGLRP